MKYCMKGGAVYGREIVSGNSPENDIVDAKLSPGEVVIDKETLAKDPKAWVKFIKSEIKKHPHLFKKNFNQGGGVVGQSGSAGKSGTDDRSWLEKASDWIDSVTPNAETYSVNTGKRIIPTGSQGVRQTYDINRQRAIESMSGAAGYARGGAVEGGNEKVSVVMREFAKNKLHSSSGKLVKSQDQSKAIAMSEAGLSYSNGGAIKENQHPMGEGGAVNNSISPENALNHYIDCDGICGGTVYDGSTDEKFLFGPYCFDIDKAREISKKQDNGDIEVSPLWLDKVKLDHDHAMQSNSKNPVFVALIHTPNGLKPLLIDGNHRMYKAVGEGKKSINAYIFSPQETASLFCAKPSGVEHPKDEGKQKFFEGGTAQPNPSDDEINQYLSQKLASAAPSDDEIEKYLSEKSGAPKPQPTKQELINSVLSNEHPAQRMNEQTGEAVKYGLKKLDEYTGAPIRKFTTELATGKSLKEAPSGAEQARMMGAPTQTYGERFGVPKEYGGNLSPADIYGIGLEVAQDPFLIGSAAIKGAGKIAGIMRAGGAEKTASETVRAAQSASASGAAEGSAKSSANISGGGLEVNQGGKTFSYNAPKNLDELNKWTPPAGSGELPGKERLAEIEKTVPDLETKPLKYHYDMMENPKAMKDLKIQFENLPTESAKKIAAYNQGIVDESAQKIQQTLHDMTGSEPKNIADSGHDLISKVKDKYDLEKASLGPIFDNIQQSAPLSAAESRDLAITIGENSKVGKLMKTDPETGRLMLDKNTPRTGLSDAEHGAISRVIEDLNDGMTFKEIQDSREFLRKLVDPANPAATAEINKVRSIMLGQLENMAAARGENVGQAFKDYAINERNRENIEKIIGGKISDLDKMYAANPESVVKKIFSNPNYAKVVGEYVGAEKMKEMAQAYIQNGISKAFDSAEGFKPHVVRNWMKSNQQFLNANVDPQTLNRISALADYGQYGKKFLSEVNPSGTAASLKAMLEPGSFFSNVKQHGFVGAVESMAANKVQAMTQQRQAIKKVNEAFGTKTQSLSDKLKNTDFSKPMSQYLTGQGAAAAGRAIGKSNQRENK